MSLMISLAEAANAAANVPVDATQKALVFAAAFAAIGFSAIGSAYGTGIAASSAIGAWKKCYMQNKTAPFQLLIFAGAPLSQTIYGMILMFSIMYSDISRPGVWIAYMTVGVLAGIAMGLSALLQGTAAAAASDAFAESGKGFTNLLMCLGIIETVAIFVMAFAMVLLALI